jgi:hypothetical protein
VVDRFTGLLVGLEGWMIREKDEKHEGEKKHYTTD